MADRMGMALRLAKEGRPEGFRFLYDYTCESQISMALDYLGDEASAKSVVQQAYQQVFDGISSVTQPEMFEPWVRDMVSYFSGQEIRMRTQDAFSESEDATYILEEDDMAITEAMDEESLVASYTPEDVSRMATELLTELTDEERICVLMHYQEGKSITEIAQTLGCTEPMAQSRIASGKQKLLSKTEFMKSRDNRILAAGILFVLAILHLQTKNRLASGAMQAAATFTIGGVTVAAGHAVASAGIAASAAGTASGMMSGSAAGFAGTAAGAGGTMATGSVSAAGAGGTMATGSVSVAGAGGMMGTGSVSVAGAGGMMATGSVSAAGAGGMMATGSVTAASAAGTAGGQIVATAAAHSAGAVLKQGLIHTVLGKVAIGVAATAIVGGTTAGIVHYNNQKNKEDIQTVTDATPMDATWMDADISEDTTEATTEEVINDEYKKIYLAVLKDHETAIRQYSQYRVALEPDQYDYIDSAPIAIEDITGDSVPELIYMEQSEGQESYTVLGSLNIYTVADGKAKQIYYSNNWDTQVAGGSTYSLFKVEGEDCLYACNGMADEFTEEYFSRFDMQENGNLNETSVMGRYKHPEGPDYDMVEDCTIGEQTVTPEAFQAELDTLTNKMTKLLLYNFKPFDENQCERMRQAEQCYLTYDEAVAQLSEGLQDSLQTETQSENLMPFSEEKHFLFMSGVGAWDTSLTIHPDGTFEGSYHDSNMGENGDGYDSTIYICEFQGAFKHVQKKDEYTYTMELDTLTCDETRDEWIETDENGTRTRYVASQAYGIEGGKTFELYLVGKRISDLSSAYLGWVNFAGTLDGLETLPAYGVYNVDMQQGFLEWER